MCTMSNKFHMLTMMSVATFMIQPAAAQAAVSRGPGPMQILLLLVVSLVTILFYFIYRRTRSIYLGDRTPAKTSTHNATRLHEREVFISYRRDDSADVSGRLYDSLASEFGHERVFKDVDSTRLGFSFTDQIASHMKSCRVAIILIGPDWIGRNAVENSRRIDSEEDFVRLEVRELLLKGVPVIPVLVRGASMPSEHELPDDIKDLSKRNGIKLRPDPDFHNDAGRLKQSIREFLAEG